MRQYDTIRFKSDRIDRIVTARILALPIFAAVMFRIYSIAMGGIRRETNNAKAPDRSEAAAPEKFAFF